MTIRLERRVFLSPCPLCPLQEACGGHEEHDGFRFGEEYVVWLKLPEMATPSGDGATMTADERIEADPTVDAGR